MYLSFFHQDSACHLKLITIGWNGRKCGTEIQGSINPNDFNGLVIIRISVILLQRPAKLNTFGTLTSSLLCTYFTHSKGLTVIIFGSLHVIITFYVWADCNSAKCKTFLVTLVCLWTISKLFNAAGLWIYLWRTLYMFFSASSQFLSLFH